MQFYDSVQTFSLLQSHKITIFSIYEKSIRYFETLFGRFDAQLWNYLGLLLLPLWSSLIVMRNKRHLPFNRWWIDIFSLFLLWRYVDFYFASSRFEGFKPLVYDFSFIVILLVVMLATQVVVASKSKRVLWLLPIGFISFFMVIGTNNKYSYFIPFYIGFFVIIGFSLINVRWLKCHQRNSSMNGAIHHGLVTAFIISIAVILFCNIALLATKPYRFFQQLDGDLQKIEFGVPPETLLASQPLAEAYNAVSHLKQDNPIAEESPTVIDWTGRSPGMALHLGLRPIETSWLVGSYPGEDMFAETVLEFAKDEDVANAWIIVSDKMTRSKTVLKSILKSHGRNFPDDYSVIGVFPNPNQNSQNYILKVKDEIISFVGR